MVGWPASEGERPTACPGTGALDASAAPKRDVLGMLQGGGHPLWPQQLQPHQDKILPRYCGACSSPGAGSSTSSFWAAARSLGPDPTCAETRDKRPLLLRGESTSGVHPQQDHLLLTPGFAAAHNTKDHLIHPRLNLLDASKDSAIFSHAKSFSQWLQNLYYCFFNTQTAL